MSGRPNRPQVDELRRAFSDYESARVSIASLSAKIKEDTRLVGEWQVRLRKAKEEVDRLMKEMDVYGPGNFGYEGRMFELLMMLSGD